MYPWSNKDEGSWADSWSGKCGGESIWQCNWIVQQASKVLRTMGSMASFSLCTRCSIGWIIYPTNENVDRSASGSWTGHLQNRIISIHRCSAKAALWNRFWVQRWFLDWRLFAYLRNIILQGYFQTYSVPLVTAPISLAPRFWTGVPRRLGKLPNTQRGVQRQLVVGCTRSVSG